jgi:hypothetical protein
MFWRRFAACPLLICRLSSASSSENSAPVVYTDGLSYSCCVGAAESSEVDSLLRQMANQSLLPNDSTNNSKTAIIYIHNDNSNNYSKGSMKRSSKNSGGG